MTCVQSLRCLYNDTSSTKDSFSSGRWRRMEFHVSCWRIVVYEEVMFANTIVKNKLRSVFYLMTQLVSLEVHFYRETFPKELKELHLNLFPHVFNLSCMGFWHGKLFSWFRIVVSLFWTWHVLCYTQAQAGRHFSHETCGFTKTEFKLKNCQYWNCLGKESRLFGTTITAHNFTEEIDYYKWILFVMSLDLLTNDFCIHTRMSEIWVL